MKKKNVKHFEKGYDTGHADGYDLGKRWGKDQGYHLALELVDKWAEAELDHMAETDTDDMEEMVFAAASGAILVFAKLRQRIEADSWSLNT